jgi:hypothetical protein
MADRHVGWEVVLLLGLPGGGGVALAAIGLLVVLAFPPAGSQTVGESPVPEIEPVRAALGLISAVALVGMAIVLLRAADENRLD